MSDISIKNIGAIASLSLNVPQDGGVVVLSGRNGSGKSTAIDAVVAAVTGKGKPPLRDLAERGEVNVSGVKLTVARGVRRTGMLEIATLEGRLSVADLVDPGIIDPARADATRIKALVGLSGVGLSADDLRGFPSDLIEGLDLSDPVAAMAELKRRLDIGGREYEKLAKTEGDRAAALLEQIGNCNDAPDVDEAMDAVIAANRELDTLTTLKKAAVDAKHNVLVSKAKLAEMPIPDVAAAKENFETQQNQVKHYEEKMEEAKEDLQEMTNCYEASLSLLAIADDRFQATKRDAEWRAGLERIIAESDLSEPSDDELSAADQKVKLAQKALEAAQRAKVAADLHQQGMDKAAEANRLEAESIALRRQAKQTEELLSEIVADIKGCPMRVNEGRLIIDTGRGPTFFGDLSHGERWKLALDIAVSAVGQGGLVAIPQEAWEGLDPSNRALVATAAKASNVLILTAEATDGPLCSAEYGKPE